MPPHSSHILQPLDVSCFAPLKLSYGRQIETFIRNRLNHITKLEFLSAFKEAFQATFTEQNIKSGFRATGLVLYEPQNVLSHLNLHLRTPTPPIVESNNWTSKTPQTIRELNFQTEHIKKRVVRHQNSSPTSINDAISCLVKGAQVMMHSAVLLKAEVKALQVANEQKKRRERRRKRRIMQGGSLSVREGEDILQTAEVDAQIRTEVASKATQQEGSKGRQRRCGLCGNTGHNARTCERHQESITIE
jgi:DDE superfamily endonuclease